jgi:hypothetical protein
MPPGCTTIPALARLMGQHPSAVYDAIYKGRGPLLTEVTPAPFTYPEPKSKRSRYVQLLAAIEWLEHRPDAQKWGDVIRTLRVQWVMDHLRRGVPLPPPPEREPEMRPRVIRSVHHFRRKRPAPAPAGYEPQTDGLMSEVLF